MNYSYGILSYPKMKLSDFTREFAHRYWIGAVVFILVAVAVSYLGAHGAIGFISGMLLVLFGLVLYAALLSVYLVLLWIFLRGKRYARAISVLLGTIILGVILTNWSSFLRQAYSTIDLVRFHLTRSHYLNVVERTPTENAPKLIFFDWGWSGHFLSATVFYALVYDETDEIARPANQRTASWNEKASKQSRVATVYESRCQSKVAHVEGHFYLVTTVCS
jgi:hypothetical protein